MRTEESSKTRFLGGIIGAVSICGIGVLNLVNMKNAIKAEN